MDLMFRHGVINRLVLPPHGLSALIDFAEAVEARSAFTKLAYTKFKNAPLYLEWAPADAFKKPFVKQEEEEEVLEEEKEPAEKEDSSKETKKVEKKMSRSISDNASSTATAKDVKTTTTG